MMRVQLSGKIEVTIDGEVVDLGSNKTQVVLAALALNAGSLVPVGRLLDLVWTEEPPRTAEKTLQVYIARLRKACGAASIERAGDAYRLVVEPDHVDLVRFDRLLDNNQNAEASALWHGPPLAGLAASGLDPAIARFTERFLTASEQLLADEIRQGRSADVVGQLRELTLANPLREGLWGLLMQALYATGRQADALRAYTEAREHLVAGLGIEPGPELQKLEQQILDQTLPLPNPPSGARASEENATLVNPHSPKARDFPPQLAYNHGVNFVGRTGQKETLLNLWQQVRSNRKPHLALLAGEPGVGKTRLAAETAREIHNCDAARVVLGRCQQDHRSPFRPFTQALMTYVDARSGSELGTELGPHPELLTPIMPRLTDRFPDLAERSLSVDVRQLDIFDAAISFLERAAVSPLVIVLDDLQWADQATLDLLLFLARNATSGELLVMATYRDVEVDRSHPLSRVLGELRREANVERIALRGVDAVESIALTEAILGHELSAEGKLLAENAGERAGGNPFFLQEMLRHFMDTGVLAREHGRWSLSNADTLTDSVPEGIREVVSRRLDQVSAECNSLLRTASALTDSIDISLLTAVSDLGEGVVLDQLDEALEAGLLIDASSADQYEFSHALIRQSLYAELSTSRRLRLHEQIANQIATTGATDESSVVAAAHHYLAAGPVAPPAVMVKWVRAAADFAAGRAAHAEAAHLLTRALDAADELLEPDDHVALLADVAATAVRLHQVDRTEESLRAITDQADRASSAALIEAVVHFTRSLVSHSEIGPSAAALKRLFEIVAARPDLDDLQRTTLAVERFCARSGDFTLEAAMEHLSAMADRDIERLAYAVGECALPLATLTLVRDRVGALAQTRAGLRPALAWLDLTRAMVSWEPVEGLAAEFHAMQLRRSDPRSAFAYSTPYAIAMRRGDYAATIQMADQLEYFTPIIYYYLDGWRSYEQEHPDPLSGVPTAVTHAVTSTTWALIPHLRPCLPDERLVRRLAAETTSMRRLPWIAHAAWELGLTDLADELWGRLEPASGLATLTFVTNYVVAVDYYLGLLAELRGDTNHAMSLHFDVIDQCRPMGYVVGEAYAAWQLVRLLGLRNSPGDINQAHALAAEILDRLEPTPLVRRKRMINEALADLPNADE